MVFVFLTASTELAEAGKPEYISLNELGVHCDEIGDTDAEIIFKCDRIREVLLNGDGESLTDEEVEAFLEK